MRIFLLMLVMTPQIIFCQRIALPQTGNTSIGKQQYVYNVNLYKISSVSYPGAKVKLKLMQNAAILNGDEMLYPKAMSDYGSLAKLCPILLLGYKNSNNACKVAEKPLLDFTDNAIVGTRVQMNIPTDKLTTETKLFLGIYAAEIILPNGTSKTLKKANVRSFRLMDMDFSVRNYIKYEVDIDGARITLEYIVERATKK